MRVNVVWINKLYLTYKYNVKETLHVIKSMAKINQKYLFSVIDTCTTGINRVSRVLLPVHGEIVLSESLIIFSLYIRVIFACKYLKCVVSCICTVI